jgi:hypothetical protein
MICQTSAWVDIPVKKTIACKNTETKIKPVVRVYKKIRNLQKEKARHEP